MSLKRCSAFTQRFDFRREVGGGFRAAAGILGVRFVHFLQVALKALVSLLEPVVEPRPREIALAAVYRLDAGAVDSQEFTSVQAEFAAQRYKAPEHLAKRPAVVAPEIRDGLEVGPEATQKPDHLEVSVGLHLQAPAGTDAVEVPIDVELQEIARIVPRSSCRFRLYAPEAGSLQIKAIDERVDEAHRVVGAAIVFHGFWKKQNLRTVITCDMCHGSQYPVFGMWVSRKGVFTQSEFFVVT